MAIKMTWCLRFESSFGKFSPQGEFVGWDEFQKAYFHKNLTEGERAKYNDLDVSYLSAVSDKFRKDLGLVLDHEWPQEYQTKRVFRNLNSMIELRNGLIAVESALKDLIEEFEPDIHQFNPIHISSRSGITPQSQYYIFVIQNHLRSFDLENSFDPEYPNIRRWKRNGNTYDTFGHPLDLESFALDPTAIAGKHIWLEHSIFGSPICISDILQSRIADAGLKIPTYYQLKAI